VLVHVTRSGVAACQARNTGHARVGRGVDGFDGQLLVALGSVDKRMQPSPIRSSEVPSHHVTS
jgi:hypothetical protein